MDPDLTIRPDPLRSARTATEGIHASLDRELAILGAKIEEFHAEKEILLAQVQAESSSQLGTQSGSNLRSPQRENRFEHEIRNWQPPQVLPPAPPVSNTCSNSRHVVMFLV
jgi:hypothetical protein